MININQIMGVILIVIGTLILGLVALFGRKYSRVAFAPFWKRLLLMRTGKKPEFYGITPEQIWIGFGTILIIFGTILAIL